MNAKILIATTLVALAGASSAFAGENSLDKQLSGISTLSRAEVTATLAAAQRAGTLNVGDASAAPVAVSTLTRTQVLAEAQEARRLGLLTFGEANERSPTAAELASIRMAGERAVSMTTAARAQ